MKKMKIIVIKMIKIKLSKVQAAKKEKLKFGPMKKMLYFIILIKNLIVNGI